MKVKKQTEIHLASVLADLLRIEIVVQEEKSTSFYGRPARGQKTISTE